MHRGALSKTDTATNTIGKRFWEEIENCHANFKLTANEYCAPVLGGTFLHCAASCEGIAYFEKKVQAILTPDMGEDEPTQGEPKA